MARFRALEDLQSSIAAEINAHTLGRDVEVLVEGKHKGRWKGRARTNKLVFFESVDDAPLAGRLVNVRITRTGPWSLLGHPAAEARLAA
jgi:tRNA-2-methylthio-N6-dimethylallyladenosine synthase